SAQDVINRRKPERELRDDAEISTPATDAPEQVRMLALACGDDTTIRHHDLGREEIVDGQTVFADHEPDPAPGRQATDADRLRVAGRERKAMLVRRAGKVERGRPGLHAGGPGNRVDGDLLHA